MRFTQNDLIDAILQALQGPGASPATPAPALPAAGPKRWKYRPETGPGARKFLTEAEIRKALTPGARHLTIPRNAIISPLAADWLALCGIEIVRE